jgi:protein O-GlcNAcase / histone acetyltransferase
MADDFLCGIIEGFYGQPWQAEQRLDLFKRLQSLGLNAYIYGPKDDDKHRNYWRDLYSSDEARHLQQLISQAKEHHINFVYALSPGLDIKYALITLN